MSASSNSTSLGWKQLGHSAYVAGLSSIYFTVVIGLIVGIIVWYKVSPPVCDSIRHDQNLTPDKSCGSPDNATGNRSWATMGRLDFEPSGIQQEMLAKMSRNALYIATCFATFAIVGGAGGIYLEFRDHTNQFVGPAIVLSAGIALITLAFLGEKRGRGHRIVIGLRNSLIVMFALVIVLAFLLILFGPLH